MLTSVTNRYPQNLIGKKGQAGRMRDVELTLITDYAAEDDITLQLYHRLVPIKPQKVRS